MVHRDLPVKTLEELQSLSTEAGENSRGHPVCSVYGFFLRAEKGQSSEYWLLGDETCMDGCRIKLTPPFSDYPHAKLGDVVRVHRLTVDRYYNVPFAIPRNVVVWPSFRQVTTPTTCARKPTITREDEERRRKLEALFCSKIFPISDLRKHQYSLNHLTAGRIEKKTHDIYGHLLLTINDGTASIVVRVFKQMPQDDLNFSTNEHFELASNQDDGDYIFVGGGKLDTRNDYLNLSCSRTYGRCLRNVEKTSILGGRISHSIEDQNNNGTVSEELPERFLRRSPRFLTAHQDVPSRRSTDLESDSSQTRSQENHKEPETSTGQIPETSTGQIPEISTGQMPEYTKLIDIMREPQRFKGYEFYDIVGQVRGKPNEARQFGNWVLQLYDGSKLDVESFLIEEVNEPVQNCVVVLIYSKQRDFDTDKHIELVKKLNDGDLIMIKNVKVSNRNGRMKFELAANLDHGKVIEIIDKESLFGRKLLETVTNPIVEELLDDQANIDVGDVSGDTSLLPSVT